MSKRAVVLKGAVPHAHVYQKRARAMFASDPNMPLTHGEFLQMTPVEEVREALANASEQTTPSSLAQQMLEVHSGDPSGLLEGQMWIRTNGTDRELCIYAGGQIRRTRLI